MEPDGNVQRRGWPISPAPSGRPTGTRRIRPRKAQERRSRPETVEGASRGDRGPGVRVRVPTAADRDGAAGWYLGRGMRPDHRALLRRNPGRLRAATWGGPLGASTTQIARAVRNGGISRGCAALSHALATPPEPPEVSRG